MRDMTLIPNTPVAIATMIFLFQIARMRSTIKREAAVMARYPKN